jgi:hypothetical protein
MGHKNRKNMLPILKHGYAFKLMSFDLTNSSPLVEDTNLFVRLVSFLSCFYHVRNIICQLTKVFYY